MQCGCKCGHPHTSKVQCRCECGPHTKISCARLIANIFKTYVKFDHFQNLELVDVTFRASDQTLQIISDFICFTYPYRAKKYSTTSAEESSFPIKVWCFKRSPGNKREVILVWPLMWKATKFPIPFEYRLCVSLLESDSTKKVFSSQFWILVQLYQKLS